MKVIKKFIQYLIATILALAILAVILINLFSSSILSKDYVLSKLEEENYYDEIYEDVKSNFENYIYQSGLEEEVLNDIVTKDKIKEDTNIMLDNIYNGMDEEVDTEEIASNLQQNISNSLGKNISATQQKAIDTFVDTICNEYKSTISHTSYEGKINTAYNKIIGYIDMAKKALLILIGVCIVILILLTIRRIYRVIAKIGVAFTIDGLILIIANYYINSKVKIEGITILNNAISSVVRNILLDILSKVMTYGSILLTLGIILIVLYAFIKSIRKIKREKDQYTPEN